MISSLRSFLYALARVLGHFQAVKKRRVGRRIFRVSIGRTIGKGIGRILR